MWKSASELGLPLNRRRRGDNVASTASVAPARPAAVAAMASRALVTWTISLAVREVAVSPLRRSLCFPPATRGDGEHYHALWTTNKTRGRCVCRRAAG